MTSDHRRADDSGEAKTRPVARVMTVRQLALVLGLVLTVVTLLQTIGLKFIADSYIDQRIKIHSVDPRAHEGAIAQAVRDGDQMHQQLESLRRDLSEATKIMNDTNQRLARIEGVLAARR